MRKRNVIIKQEAEIDLHQIRLFVSGCYRKESGIKFVKRMFLEIKPLSENADIFPPSPYQTARKIHPEAKTLSIMNHHWTVVFHIEGDYVVVDRILPSTTLAE